MATRVVVTGLGVVSPIGITLDAYWNALLYEESVPREFPYASRAYMQNRLAYCVGGDGTDSGGRDAESRTVRFAADAAAAALRDAGLDTACDTDDAGICLGTATGNHDLLEAEREHPRHGAGVAAQRAYPFSVTAAVAERLHLDGPALTVSTACAAGCYGVSLAAEMIAAGRAELMVAGGADSISRVTQACFNRLDALDGEACRPFDANRTGTVYGEGAAILVLESESHARRRGHSSAYAEIRGAGWSCDGHHPTAPDPSARQIEVALRRALSDADLAPDDIGCIVAHGTGTELNDIAESNGMAQVFGAALGRVRVCAPKSKLGHTAGAAGAFSCLTAALILERGLVPPTANLSSVDPRCRLSLHTDWPVPADARNVLVNAYAFGGNNISLILSAA